MVPRFYRLECTELQEVPNSQQPEIYRNNLSN